MKKNVLISYVVEADSDLSAIFALNKSLATLPDSELVKFDAFDVMEVIVTGKDYVETAKILNYVSDKTHTAVFSKMVVDFAEMFAKDNPRFDANRFYSAANYKIPSFRS